MAFVTFPRSNSIEVVRTEVVSIELFAKIEKSHFSGNDLYEVRETDFFFNFFFSYVQASRAIMEALPISRHCLGCQCLKLPEIGRTQRPRRRVQIMIGLAWYRVRRRPTAFN